jgi:hypothetical protein
VREQHWRHVEVVLDQVSFGDAELRPEELVQVCEANDFVVDLDVESVRVFGELDLGDWGLAAFSRSSFNYGRMVVARRKLKGHLVKVKP